VHHAALPERAANKQVLARAYLEMRAAVRSEPTAKGLSIERMCYDVFFRPASAVACASYVWRSGGEKSRRRTEVVEGSHSLETWWIGHTYLFARGGQALKHRLLLSS
jgi:hypothetical protein